MAFFQGICFQCGEDFHRMNIAKAKSQTFCSKKCYSAWRISKARVAPVDTSRLSGERCRIPLCEKRIDEDGMCGYHHTRYKWVLEFAK